MTLLTFPLCVRVPFQRYKKAIMYKISISINIDYFYVSAGRHLSSVASFANSPMNKNSFNLECVFILLLSKLMEDYITFSIPRPTLNFNGIFSSLRELFGVSNDFCKYVFLQFVFYALFNTGIYGIPRKAIPTQKFLFRSF